MVFILKWDQVIFLNDALHFYITPFIFYDNKVDTLQFAYDGKMCVNISEFQYWSLYHSLLCYV